MRFFHISDLHIGKHLHYYDLKEDQRYILSRIADAAEEQRPDAIVIAGDIYDRSVPSAEAVSLFDWFLTRLADIRPAIPVLAIAGNHDSAERLDYASAILGRHHIHVAGMPPAREEERMKKVTLQDAYGEVCFYLLPFVKPGYVRPAFPQGQAPEDYDGAVRGLVEREQIDTSVRNVIVTHQFYTAAGVPPLAAVSESVRVGGLDNVDISALADFDYCALGHIHRRQQVGEGPAWYCGTPLKYSVSESRDQKTLTIVELKEKGTPPVRTEIPLEPLHEVREIKGTLEEVLAGAGEEIRQDYVSVTLTDEKALYEPADQLERIFPRLLQVRLESLRARLNGEEGTQEPDLDLADPLEVFGQFFEEMQGRPMDREEESIMREMFKEGIE